MKKIAAVVVAVVLVAAIFFGGYVFDAYFIAPGPEAENVTFTVTQGEGVSMIADHLVEARVIKSAFPFKLYVKFSGASTNMQAGVFDLKTGMSYAAIVDTLARASAEEIEVTIPEGYTLKQIGETVRTAIPSITEDEWNAAVGVDSTFKTHPFVVAAGKPDGVDLEGYLFPDTYRFFADATAEDVVERMIDTMQTKAVAMTHAQLTLASIVEREVRGAEDMKIVADLFLRRIDMGMALQADSTINYVIDGDDPSVSAEDLELDSPYNTYKYPGLPPGPISNPGMNAIQAVLHPTPNAWYYFLTADDGTVYYAKTFDEHVANKNRYLR